MIHKFTIEYQFGTYSGTEVVTLSGDDDRDPKAVMWARLRNQGKLTLAMMLSWRQRENFGTLTMRGKSKHFSTKCWGNNV